MSLPCGCEPDASGYGYCAKCVRTLRQKIWNKMSEEKKNYDRQFAPKQSAFLDANVDYENRGCSCHINPPCSFCVDGGHKNN